MYEELNVKPEDLLEEFEDSKKYFLTDKDVKEVINEFDSDFISDEEYIEIEKNHDNENKLKRELLSDLQNLYFINKYILSENYIKIENKSFKFLVNDNKIKMDYKLFYKENGFELKTNVDFFNNTNEIHTIFLIPIQNNKNYSKLFLSKDVKIDFLFDLVFVIKSRNLNLSEEFSIKELEKAFENHKKIFNETFEKGINSLKKFKIIEVSGGKFIFSKLIQEYIEQLISEKSYVE